MCYGEFNSVILKSNFLVILKISVCQLSNHLSFTIIELFIPTST